MFATKLAFLLLMTHMPFMREHKECPIDKSQESQLPPPDLILPKNPRLAPKKRMTLSGDIKNKIPHHLLKTKKTKFHLPKQPIKKNFF